MDWDKWIEKLQADPENFDIDRETRIAVRSSPEWLEECGPPPPENPVEGLEDFFLNDLLEVLQTEAPFELEPIFKFDLTGDTDNHHFISCSAILSLDRFRIGDTFYLVEYFEAIDFHQYCELKGTHTTETEHAVLNGFAGTFGQFFLDDGWPSPEVSNFIEPIVPELVWFHRFGGYGLGGKNDRMTDLPFKLDRRVIDVRKVNWAAVAMAAWVWGWGL